MTQPSVLAGVDIGGTKVAVGFATPVGEVLASLREPLAPAGGEAVITQAIDLLQRLLREHSLSLDALASIGIAVPAVIDETHQAVLWAPNIPGWQERLEVAPIITRALHAPASLYYDGHAWAVGEWWCGAAQGAKDVVVVAVGTGIGGGIILNNQLHRGRVGVAGAIGWWVPDWRLAGKERDRADGWLEIFASGPAIARAANCPSTEAAFALAREGNRHAKLAVAHAALTLGSAVANLVSLLDPEVVVLAGGVIAGGADLLLPVIEGIVRQEAQPQMAQGVKIVPAARGDDAAWLGAAKLAYDAK